MHTIIKRHEAEIEDLETIIENLRRQNEELISEAVEMKAKNENEKAEMLLEIKEQKGVIIKL